MRDPERILVRAPNWAGDLVMATPGLRALRAAFPRAEITLHVRPALAPLVAGSPHIDAVLPLEAARRWRAARSLRGARFDLGVCLPDSFSAALLMRIAGVRRVAGYATQWRRPLLDVAVPAPAGMISRERHVLGLLDALGVAAQGTALELFVTDAEAARANALLAQHGIGAAEPIVALAPGASYGESKCWPAESFTAVGDALAQDGARVVVIGSPDEAPLAGRVAAAMHLPAAVLAGALDLGAAKAVLARSRVLVANDAGARHVAVALGVPSVVLFGPTAVEKTDCNLDLVRVLTADVACRPCYRRTCPIDHRCMTRIDPERVIEAARPALLANESPPTIRSTDPRFRRSEPKPSGQGGAEGAHQLAVREATNPDLSIVLLTWNGRDLTLACLDSIDREIRSRTDAGRIETETIVVDNGSHDGTVEAVRNRFPWAQVVALPRNRGFAGGNNAGLAHARGRVLCLLNNDTVVQRDGLEACVRFVDAHADVGVVGPELRDPDGPKQNSIHAFPTLLLEVVPRGVLEWVAPRRYPSKRVAHTAPVDVEAVLGACLVVRREALLAVGPLPEDYFFFLEETDWCFAMRAAGWRVVHLPGAPLVHVHGAGTKKVVPLATRIEYHRSLYHFFAKRRGAGAAVAVRAIRVAKLVLALVLFAPAALVLPRERERWRQRAWILAWHVAGRPRAWGLAGVGARAEGSA